MASELPNESAAAASVVGPAASSELDSYLDVLLKRKWLILLLALITAGVAFVVALRQPTVYTASARVMVKPTALNPLGSIPTISTINLPTEAEIARSGTVTALAADSLDLDAAAFREDTAVSYLPDTQVLIVSYSSADAPSAQTGAQALAESYLKDRGDQAAASAEQVIADASEQIAELRQQATKAAQAAAAAEPGSSEQAENSTLAQQLSTRVAIMESNISAINTQALDPGRVLVAAGVPSQPSSPDPTQAAVRGFLLGLLIGVVAALTIDASHRRRRRTR